MADLRWLWTPRAARVATLLADAGRSGRIVGGAVRDGLMGREPDDLDLATDATPAEMLEIGERTGARTIPLLSEVRARPGEWEKGGLKHGTVPFVIDGEVVDVTTLRVDVETDGRHASVRFVRDYEADAARRDFTFNAMSVDLDGRLHDYFGGEADLRSGVVRFVGSAGARIAEDVLRILRFFRFNARYGAPGSPPDGATLAAIADRSADMARLSGERIRDEMGKIISTQGGLDQLALMGACGVLRQVCLPEDGDVAAARVAALNGAPAPAILGLLLVRPGRLPGPTPAEVGARWKLSNDDLAVAQAAHDLHCQGMAGAPFGAFMDMALRPRARRDDLAAALVAFGRPDDADRILGALPEFPLKGADLVSAGMAPGPGVGARLEELRDAWRASGYAATREDLLAIAAPSPGPRG